jgi:hypothetical protein
VLASGAASSAAYAAADAASRVDITKLDTRLTRSLPCLKFRRGNL